MKKFLILICCIFVFVTAATIQIVFVSDNNIDSAYAMTSDIVPNALPKDIEDRVIKSSDIVVVTRIKECIINKDQLIIVDFAFDGQITDYYFKGDGISVAKSFKNKNIVHAELSVENQEGNLDIYLKYPNGTYIKSGIHTYLDSGMIFCSEDSFGDAWTKALNYKYQNGIITEKERQNEYAVFSRRDVEENITVVEPRTVTDDSKADATVQKSGSSDKTTYVEGTLFWMTDIGNNHSRRLSKMRVELYDYDQLDSDECLASCTTDYNGHYSFEFQNDESIWELGGCDPYIRVYASDTTFVVGANLLDLILYEFYYCDSTITYDVSTGSTVYINMVFYYTPDNNINNAFYIAQGLVAARTFFWDMTHSFSGDILQVQYPFHLGISFCYGVIMCLNSEDFDDWDTVMHEYGHYVEHQMGTYGIDLIDFIYGAEHDFNEDDVVAHSNIKNYGLQLAWSEAWAYAFAFIAQEYYNENYMDIDGAVPDVCDVELEGDFDCESPRMLGENPLLGGEANEWAITCFLWDLFDHDEGSWDAPDVIEMGYSDWWDMTTQSGTYTLSDFVNILDAEYEEDDHDNIGELLRFFKMAPCFFTFSGFPEPGQPLTSNAQITFSWQAGGRPASPNNRFNIRIYNASRNLVWTSGNKTGTTCTLTVAELSEILAILGYNPTTMYVGLTGWHTASPLTGPYFTKTHPIEVFNVLSVSSQTRYTEFVDSSLLGIWSSAYISFAASGSKIIQTFGTKDTKIRIYNAAGDLIGSNDDGGYSNNALIAINANANEVYRIRVRFYSILTAGSFKVAIISAPGVNNYDNITMFAPSSPPIAVTAAAGLSCLYTFKPTVSGTYTIYTSSSGTSADSFIYVIDPRSTSLITSSDYNDNYSGLYSSITKSFSANVPYLVIASKNNLTLNQFYLLNNS